MLLGIGAVFEDIGRSGDMFRRYAVCPPFAAMMPDLELECIPTPIMPAPPGLPYFSGEAALSETIDIGLELAGVLFGVRVGVDDELSVRLSLGPDLGVIFELSCA